jgi:hypothetical protein
MVMNKQFVVMSGALLLLMLNVSLAAGMEPEKVSSLRTDTFAVACYDVGRAALARQEGIIAVRNGWQDGREVNRVIYDPERVGRNVIEDRLRQSGTYIETLPTSK